MAKKRRVEEQARPGLEDNARDEIRENYAHSHGEDGSPEWEGEEQDREGHLHSHDDEDGDEVQDEDDGEDTLPHRHGDDGDLAWPGGEDEEDDKEEPPKRGGGKGIMSKAVDASAQPDVTVLDQDLLLSTIREAASEGSPKKLRKAVEQIGELVAERLTAYDAKIEALTKAVSEQGELVRASGEEITKALAAGVPIAKAVEAPAGDPVQTIDVAARSAAGAIGATKPADGTQAIAKSLDTSTAEGVAAAIDGTQQAAKPNYRALEKSISAIVDREGTAAVIGVTVDESIAISKDRLSADRCEAISKAIAEHAKSA